MLTPEIQKPFTMATFSTLIASGKIDSAYLTKQAVLVEINRDLERIKALDREIQVVGNSVS